MTSPLSLPAAGLSVSRTPVLRLLTLPRISLVIRRNVKLSMQNMRSCEITVNISFKKAEDCKTSKRQSKLAILPDAGKNWYFLRLFLLIAAGSAGGMLHAQVNFRISYIHTHIHTYTHTYIHTYIQHTLEGWGCPRTSIGDGGMDPQQAGGCRQPWLIHRHI
jgi:hypothetical protein